MTRITDFHSHIGETVGKSKEDLLRSMDEAGIERSVIYAGGCLLMSNEELIRTIKWHPDRFLGACSLTGQELHDADKVREAEELLLRDDIIGMKFYTGYEHYYATDPGLEPCFEAIQKQGKVAIFHSGDTYSVKKDAKLKYAQPLAFDDVAVDHPELKVVIAHMGYPWHRDTAEVMYKNSNVYTDISGYVYGEFTSITRAQLRQVVDEFFFIYGSMDRVLFGTDFPISNQRSYVESMKTNNIFDVTSKNTNDLINQILGK